MVSPVLDPGSGRGAGRVDLGHQRAAEGVLEERLRRSRLVVVDKREVLRRAAGGFVPEVVAAAVAEQPAAGVGAAPGVGEVARRAEVCVRRQVEVPVTPVVRRPATVAL